MNDDIMSLWYYQEVIDSSNLKIWDKMIFCDIDGTIFRDSLYIEIYLWLIYNGMSSPVAYKRELAKNSLKIHEEALSKWKNREWGYDQYLHVILNSFTDLANWLHEANFNAICEAIVKEKSKRTYVFPMELLKKKQSEWYKIILISWSPDHVVRNFAYEHWFDIWMWSYYFTDTEWYLTWEKALLAISKSKESLVNYILEKYAPSHTISLWDTNWDYRMLMMTDNGIAMNPSYELYSKIVELENIEVVVERKDLVLRLNSSQRKYVEFLSNTDRVF